MRRYLWLLLVPLFFFVHSVCAQNQSSIDAYQQFLNSYRRYQGLIEPFNTKKSRHLAYQSVATQAELLQSSKELIAAEIEAMISYTSFIRALLAEATQILNYQENFLYIKLDDELSFLKSSKERVASLSSLNEADEILADLSAHFKKITKMAYQVKSLIEVEGTKKIFENLKVEKEKIGSFMAAERTDEAKILAAKEKFNELEKELNNADGLIKTAVEYQKNLETNDPAGVSRQIRTTIDEALKKISLVVAGYKNIVFSLK